MVDCISSLPFLIIFTSLFKWRLLHLNKVRTDLEMLLRQFLVIETSV